MNRKIFCLVSVFILSAMLLNSAYVQAGTPGQIPMFDEPGTGGCDISPGANNNCIDSVITQDPSGNIGIGTTTPAEKLDVTGRNVNLDDSTDTTGNILKGGDLFLHNFGTNNTFIGKNAGNLTTSGSGHNTAIGFQALQPNTTGNFNTAIGALALSFNTTGSDNTAIGLGALSFNTTGRFNTASGEHALSFNTTGSSNTASGFQALFTARGSNNTASGFRALFNTITTSGSDNTASGFQALFNNTTGSDNTAIGARADVSAGDLTNATAIGADAIVDDSKKIRLGNTAVTVIEAQVGLTIVSDRTKKENFQPVDGEEVLRKIGGLSLTSWNYIGHDPKQFRHYGPMGQEFFAAFGDDGIGTIGTPTTISSTDIAGILMIAVQTLEKRTVELKALQGRVENLEVEKRTVGAENTDLKARFEALERLVKTTQTAWSEATK